MQVDGIQLQLGQPSVHNVRYSSAQGQSGIQWSGYKCVHEHAPACSGTPTDYGTKRSQTILRE